MAYFYSHIVEIETVTSKLDEMNLKDDHKKHLTQLVDSTIHHTVLDIILSRLSDADKKIFLEKLAENPSDKELLNFVTTKVGGIEGEIKKAVKELKEELHADIKEAQKL